MARRVTVGLPPCGDSCAVAVPGAVPGPRAGSASCGRFRLTGAILRADIDFSAVAYGGCRAHDDAEPMHVLNSGEQI